MKKGRADSCPLSVIRHPPSATCNPTTPRPTTSDLRPTPYALRPTSHDQRPTTNDLRPPTCVLRPTTYVPRPTSCCHPSPVTRHPSLQYLLDLRRKTLVGHPRRRIEADDAGSVDQHERRRRGDSVSEHRFVADRNRHGV